MAVLKTKTAILIFIRFTNLTNCKSLNCKFLKGCLQHLDLQKQLSNGQ